MMLDQNAWPLAQSESWSSPTLTLEVTVEMVLAPAHQLLGLMVQTC